MSGAPPGSGAAPLEVEITPPWPYRLPRGSGGDGVVRRYGKATARLLHAAGRPVLVRAWQPGPKRVVLRAESVDPEAVDCPQVIGQPVADRPAGRAELELAIERVRFALAVDDDLSGFYARFRRDRLLGPVIRRLPHLRAWRRPWPWEALAWAITMQLIESPRAAAIQRRIVCRWGPRLGDGSEALRDVPCAAVIAGRAPPELQALDLAAGRAVAMRRVARYAAGPNCDLLDPGADARLLSTPGIGPWTLQCLGLHGRGDVDSLPAGDLGFLKLVGRLAVLGRRASVSEVEEFFAPYAPYRGLAGAFALAGLHKLVRQGPPLRIAA